jgi:hypothetical protein
MREVNMPKTISALAAALVAAFGLAAPAQAATQAQFDNIVATLNPPVPTVPVPGALPWFATALAGLGISGWRRHKTSVGQLTVPAWAKKSSSRRCSGTCPPAGLVQIMVVAF